MLEQCQDPTPSPSSSSLCLLLSGSVSAGVTMTAPTAPGSDPVSSAIPMERVGWSPTCSYQVLGAMLTVCDWPSMSHRPTLSQSQTPTRNGSFLSTKQPKRHPKTQLIACQEWSKSMAAITLARCLSIRLPPSAFPFRLCFPHSSLPTS